MNLKKDFQFLYQDPSIDFESKESKLVSENNKQAVQEMQRPRFSPVNAYVTVTLLRYFRRNKSRDSKIKSHILDFLKGSTLRID